MVKGKIKKHKVLYTCDICGKGYKKADAAEKCEAAHYCSSSGFKKLLGRLFRRSNKE